MSNAQPASAIVFPGQGSQQPGMAQAWQDHPAFALWAQADDILQRDVTHLGVKAGADELREPLNCQIALFVHHAVLLEAWRAGGPARPLATAGHSLGEYDALLAADVLAFEDGLRLEVGAAYHSPHMEPAVEAFGAALDVAEFRTAQIPVIANVDASVHQDPTQWPSLLRRQLTAPVRWRETVLTLAAEGCEEVVELGASPVLTGMVKRIDASLARRTVSQPGDLA